MTPVIATADQHSLERLPIWTRKFADKLTDGQKKHYQSGKLMKVDSFEQRGEYKAFQQAYFKEVGQVGELEAYPSESLQPGKGKTIRPLLWALEVPISRELARRSPWLCDQISERLADATAYSVEKLKMDPINRGSDGTYTTLDGTNFFATTHNDLQGVSLGASSNNFASAAFSPENVYAADVAMMRTPSLRGIEQPRTAKYMITGPELMGPVNAFLNSYAGLTSFVNGAVPGQSTAQTYGTIGEKNIFFNKYEPIMTNFITKTTAPYSWFLADEPTGEQLLALWEVRPEFSVVQNPNNGAKTFKVYYSFNVGVLDWRGWYCGTT